MPKRKSQKPPPDLQENSPSSNQPPAELLTVNQAVVRVYSLLLEGHSQPDILEACRELFPNHDPQTLLNAAMAGLAAVAAEPRDVTIGFCMAAARDLFRKMTEVGDFSGALGALKELHRLATANAKAQPSIDDYLASIPEVGQTQEHLLDLLRKET